MQDLTLIRPGHTADGELSVDLGKAALKKGICGAPSLPIP